MITGLGHCEDTACCQSSSNDELVRLFRCSIHCDRLLCLYHLNAHNVYYEEEKKQNDAVLNELKDSLTLYQTIFEQHILSYRELVHQASTVLLHNTSSIIPIEQLHPILEKLQRAVAIYQQEKIIIKSEPVLDGMEFNIDSILSKDVPSIVKEESNTPEKNPNEPARNVVVRLERIDYNKEIQLEKRLHVEVTNKNDSNDDVAIRLISPVPDENQQLDNKRSRILSADSSERKLYETIKKKNDKMVPLKRLQS